MLRSCVSMCAFALLFACVGLGSSVASAQTQGASHAQQTAVVSGRIFSAQGGLPIAGATIELDEGPTTIATTTTDANGNFSFPRVSPGVYSVLISAQGFQTSRSNNFEIEFGQPSYSFQTAIFPATGLKTIAHVSTAGTAALQTTSTINEHLNPELLQSEDFNRSVDALITLPGVVNFSPSQAAGDDMELSIRGFDSTETATLLDGHPVGPVGASGNGYNYSVSPFWGLSAADVIFGSGATGLFGATTIAGAVDFETIDPTLKPQFVVEQGIGTDEKLMTGLQATGTVGNLGYAFAWGTQGTNGQFPGAYITQRALLQNSVINPPYCPSPGNCNAPPPDLTTANVDNFLNTYWVTGQYSQKNFVGKLRYAFTPDTQLQLTVYSASVWANSTGNGDDDYETYPYVLYGALQTIASGPNTILVNGTPQTCTGSIAVLVNASPGYKCMSATQYAQNFYGPFGGGIDKWKTTANQDYDARITQALGVGQLTVEGFADAYNYDEMKGPGAPLGVYTTYGPGPDYLNLYHNRGFVTAYDLPLSKNDIGFGYSWLHESETDGQYPYFLANGNQILAFGNNPPLYLATASYFARDTWTPNEKLQVFGTFWVQRSLDTSSTHVDPRVSVMYRPDPRDVFRVAAGRSYSEPDPSLIVPAPPVYSSPGSINCPPQTSGPGAITTVASINNPSLRPETASDLELAYGHQFGIRTNIQADVYQSWESGALLNGVEGLTAVPGIVVPPVYVSEALNRLSKCAGLNPTVADLGFQTTFNASGARYRGVDLSTSVALTRNLTFLADYAITSAAWVGIPQSILYQNPSYLDGGQIYGIPLRTANAGLAYQTFGGFAARIDATYVGPFNSYYRAPFWYANGGISQEINSHLTLNFGVQNIFDSAVGQYGLIGAGVFVPVNFYGSYAFGGPHNALDEGSEEFGLLPRQFWFTVRVST
jgi:outer membrane receptor protein involved in Fe transport